MVFNVAITRRFSLDEFMNNHFFYDEATLLMGFYDACYDNNYTSIAEAFDKEVADNMVEYAYRYDVVEEEDLCELIRSDEFMSFLSECNDLVEKLLCVKSEAKDCEDADAVFLEMVNFLADTVPVEMVDSLAHEVDPYDNAEIVEGKRFIEFCLHTIDTLRTEPQELTKELRNILEEYIGEDGYGYDEVKDYIYWITDHFVVTHIK